MEREKKNRTVFMLPSRRAYSSSTSCSSGESVVVRCESCRRAGVVVDIVSQCDGFC